MKIPVIAFFFSFITISASAQIERKPVVVKADSTQTTSSDIKVDKQSRRDRFKELDLAREQKGMLKEIMQTGKAAKDVIENDSKLSEEEKKKQKYALQKAQLQKIQAILTTEQLAKFKASRQDNP